MQTKSAIASGNAVLSGSVVCSGVGPARIQRKRTKGWRKPENTVCVTRPHRFGNPFDTAKEFRQVLEKIMSDATGEIDLRDCSLADFVHMQGIANTLGELRGKNLACFCSLEKECHADVLLEFANR